MINVIRIVNGFMTNYYCETPEKAEELFLELCRESVWNFDEYTLGDIESILEDGVCKAGNITIAINWPRQITES